MARLTTEEQVEFLTQLMEAQKCMVSHILDIFRTTPDAAERQRREKPYITASLALERLTHQVSRGGYDSEVRDE